MAELSGAASAGGSGRCGGCRRAAGRPATATSGGRRHTAPRDVRHQGGGDPAIWPRSRPTWPGRVDRPSAGRMTFAEWAGSLAGRPRSTCGPTPGRCTGTCCAGSCCRRSSRYGAGRPGRDGGPGLAGRLEREAVAPNTAPRPTGCWPASWTRPSRRLPDVRNPCTVRGAATERAAEMRFATVAELAALADAIPPPVPGAGPGGGLRRAALGRAGRPAGQAGGPAARPDHRGRAGAEVAASSLVGPPKTGAGLRTVTLPTVAAAALAEHLSTYARPARMGWCSRPPGRPAPPQQLQPAGLAPGHPSGRLEGLRFHDLRHTAATLAVAAGASTRELMVRMGHSSSAAACATSTSWPAGTPPSRPLWTS